VTSKSDIECGQIEEKELKDVLKDPLNLPEGFEWSNLDLKDMKQAQELYELLTGNYVEDKQHTFRFDYAIDFLQWALLVPGYR